MRGKFWRGYKSLYTPLGTPLQGATVARHAAAQQQQYGPMT